MNQAVANQQTFAFSQKTSETVTLLIKSLKLDKRGGLSSMQAMICKILVDPISYPLAILINKFYGASIILQLPKVCCRDTNFQEKK